MARPRGHLLNDAAWRFVISSAGKTLTAVANDSDLNRATLSGLVAGHHAASTAQAERIATELGVEVQVLFPSIGSDRFESLPPPKKAQR